MNGEGTTKHSRSGQKALPRPEMASFGPWRPLVSSSDRISIRVPFSSLATERASEEPEFGSKSRGIAA